MKKNNLKNLRCYLAGPIEYSKDSYTTHINEVKVFLTKKGTKILDPKKIKFKGISELQDRHELFKNKKFDEIRNQMKIIVRKDLRCVDISDFIIASLPKDIRTTGTIHEIIEADRQKKPVLLYCKEGIEHIPAWLFGIVPVEYMFSNVSEMIHYLEKIDNISNTAYYSDDRWQFILSSLSATETNY